jgi:hypothetical protein
MQANSERVKRKVVWGGAVVVTVLFSALSFGGCGDAIRQGRGPAYLVLMSLTGASGATPDQFGNTVSSDVQTYVDAGDVRVPTVFEDLGRAQLRVEMKDVGLPGQPNAPSPNNLITVTRYRVTFSRADGRNTPGVDVPHPFDGAASATITGTATTVGFVLVRVQAKDEPPLRALVGNGGAGVISTIAEVTLYGTDQTGNSVSAVGRISVNFADWGDPS